MKTISMFVLIFAAAASAVTSHPRWALHSYSGKRDFYIDQSSCHPLKYFSSDPKRFDYGEDLLVKQPADLKDKVESQRVGRIAGYTVYEIVHNINDGDLVIKMILVERKDGEFCEIFQQQFDAVNVIVEPPYFVNVNSETTLATSDRVTGTGAFLIEEYWTFDKDGPIPLDASAKINEITQRLLPPGRTIMNGSAFNIETLRYSTPVWQAGDAHCCPSGGSVRIQFALKDHRLTVTSQSLDPK
ncbi:MAG: hypothetical protein ABSD76_01125 [Terriglobales bacterium]|jgi:hypothetical protein